MCETHALTEAAGERELGRNCATDTRTDSVSELEQQQASSGVVCRCERGECFGLTGPVANESPVAGFRWGWVTSVIYVSDKCIPNEAVSTSERRRRAADRVFPTGIDRCLFVFAIGPDSINPACVMITVPPCQQVSEREGVKRGEKEGRGGGRGGGDGGGDEERSGGGGMGLLSFLTHTWQMSSHRVGLRERKRRVSAVVVSQIENR